MLTNTPSAQTTARDVRVVNRLNSILRASGLAVGKASTQIYAEPNHVHIIAPADLAFLAQHAPTLIENKAVVCDFSALSVVLWGMLVDVDRQLDEAARDLKIDIERSLDVRRDAKYRASKAARERAQRSSAKENHSLTGTLTVGNCKTTTTRGGSSALRRAAQMAGSRAPQLGPTSTPDDVQTALFPGLRQLVRVSALLRELQEPQSREVLAQRVFVTQVNIDTTAQLVLKLSDVLARLATTAKENPCLGILGRPYTKRAHSLARMTEVGLGSVLLLLTAFASAPHIDIAPVVTVYHAPSVWSAAGLGELSTESYCRGLRGVVESLLQRQADFEDNVEEVAAHLVLHRLARRPTYRPEVFRHLYFGLTERDDVTMPETNPAAPFIKELGVLLTMSRVQTNLEFLFFPPPGLTDGSTAKSLSRLRAATHRELRALEDEGATLSFSQLLVLATVTGMPEVDLTDGEALLKRAKNTEMAEAGTFPEKDDRTVSFLRLLMAYTYTTPTAANVTHGFLSTESVMALFRSIARHVFQIPLFEIEDGRYLSQHHVQASLRTPALVKVVLFHIVHTHADAPSLTQTSASRATVEADATTDTSGAADTPSAYADTVLDKAKAATAADLIAIESAVMLKAMFRTNNSREEARLARRTGGNTFSDALRAVTLHNVTQLFTIFNDPLFVQQANFDLALRSVATIYALRVLHPVSGHATEMERRRALLLIGRMQIRLTRIPQQMNRHDVTRVFVSQLVPRATTACVQRGNRLELGLTEAYLRALSTSSAANAVREDVMAKHWVDVALPCLTNRFSAALSIAAHDFFVAPFLARKSLSLLFVGTYVAAFVPTSEPLYGEPSLPLLKRFASFCRAACQGLESIDNTELREQLDNPNSFVYSLAPNESARDAFRKLTPTSAVLLVVAALFDKMCMVLNGATGFSQDAQERFIAYFSSLVNLLQCKNGGVLQRVCASIEAVEVEHLQGMGQVQAQFLKYIGTTVDQVQGSTKKQVAEWYLRLTHRVLKKTPSKL